MPRARRTTHCRGCGETKRLHWPRYEPSFCSMGCAAGLALGVCSAGNDFGFCPVCGEYACARDHMFNEDEEALEALRA